MTEPVLAPFALLRIAALPCTALSELRPPNVSRLCDEFLAAKLEMERLRPIVENHLHSAVPRAEDKKLRGELIELRRAVHNGQRFALSEITRATLFALLESGAAHTLGEWLGSRAAVDDCLAIADVVLATDMQHHVRPRMRLLAATPDFARALALASPDLFRQLAKEFALQPSDSGPTKAERSLLGYLMRASVKANPFSTFMHVAVVELDRQGVASAPELEGVARVSSCVISRSIIARLHRAMVLAVAVRGRTRLALNKSLREIDQGVVEAYTSDYVIVLGRSWRLARRATFRLHPHVIRLLLGLGGEFVFSDIVAVLSTSGLDGVQSARLAQKLLSSGCVEAEALTDAFDADVKAALTHCFDAGDEAENEVGFRAVGDLTREFERVASADAGDRPPLVAKLRAHEVAALSAFGSGE